MASPFKWKEMVENVLGSISKCVEANKSTGSQCLGPGRGTQEI